MKAVAVLPGKPNSVHLQEIAVPSLSDQPHPHVCRIDEGRGVLEVEGDSVDVSEGKAAFVPAGADHRFTGYEGLSVLVVFSRPHRAERPNRCCLRPGPRPWPR